MDLDVWLYTDDGKRSNMNTVLCIHVHVGDLRSVQQYVNRGRGKLFTLLVWQLGGCHHIHNDTDIYSDCTRDYPSYIGRGL